MEYELKPVPEGGWEVWIKTDDKGNWESAGIVRDENEAEAILNNRMGVSFVIGLRTPYGNSYYNEMHNCMGCKYFATKYDTSEDAHQSLWRLNQFLIQKMSMRNLYHDPFVECLVEDQ